jgi:hypothetical protein
MRSRWPGAEGPPIRADRGISGAKAWYFCADFGAYLGDGPVFSITYWVRLAKNVFLGGEASARGRGATERTAGLRPGVTAARQGARFLPVRASRSVLCGMRWGGGRGAAGISGCFCRGKFFGLPVTRRVFGAGISVALPQTYLLISSKHRLPGRERWRSGSAGVGSGFRRERWDGTHSSSSFPKHPCDLAPNDLFTCLPHSFGVSNLCAPAESCPKHPLQTLLD